MIVPITVIMFTSLYLNPRNEKLDPPPANSSERWQFKLREMNASLLGLGVSLATAIIVFTGVKNLSGKPRPDFLARCDPDVENIVAYTVGGYGQSVSPLWVVVDGGICQQPDKKFLNDGFRSFPSGYATSETTKLLDSARY